MSTSSMNGATSEFESTTSRIASAAHGAIDSAAESAEKLEQQVRQKASDAGDSIEKTHEAATEQVKSSIASLESMVRSKPVAAAGIAFAVGALATALLRRS